MRTLVNIEISIESAVYKVAHKALPDPNAPERHLIVVSKNEKLANVLLRELENRETLEEYKEIADFYENEQPWLFIAIYGMNLLVINNSNLVVYHEQSGKTTCLTDPLFDFTHRLTWQEEEGSRVKTVSQATAHEDDVLRIEENGLRVGRIFIRYIEQLFDEQMYEESSATRVHVSPLRSKAAPLILVAVILVTVMGLLIGFNSSHFIGWRKPTPVVPETPTTSTTNIGSEVLEFVKTATKASLGNVSGKWVAVKNSHWYVSDGSFLYTDYGKNAVSSSKGIYVGKLWYVDSIWFLEYSDGMVHLSSLKGNQVSLIGTDKSDFDNIVDFTAYSSEKTATALVLVEDGMHIYSGENYLSLKRSVGYPSGYKYFGTVGRDPLTFLVSNGKDVKILRVKGEVLENVGSVDSSRWAMLYGNQVYTIDGNVFHTQSVDLQLPFTASRIAAIDGNNVLLKQPCELLEVKP